MMSIRLVMTITLIFLIAGANVQAAAPAIAPSDAEIHQLLVNRIDVEKQGVGIVVGVIEPKGRRVVSYGSLERGDKRTLDGDTLFEIGSITKVFTALLLTDMAQRREVKLDDPIAKYLPSTVKMPTRNGKEITLVDLATHTSGLPRMPANFRPKDPANPFADYTADQLYAFLSSYELTRDAGVKYEYSNLGFGLLGQGLANRAGTDYESLVASRITGPLGMKSTRGSLSPEMNLRLAVGHSADLVTVPSWDHAALAGAGSLRSSANDMLVFLAAYLGYTKSPLSTAMKSMLSVTRPTGMPFLDSALGWAIDTRGGSEIIWKNGGTGGYRTFIGYSPKTGVGIIALSNVSTQSGVDDIGLHLLDSRFPLQTPAGTAKETSVDSKLLDIYVGHYELAPNFILAITRDGNQLFTQATGQQRAAIYAKSDREFFLKVVDAQISFETDPEGHAIALVLHQNGHDRRAKRIDDALAKQLEDTVAKRFKDQTAYPGGEASIRRLIDELRKKQVNHEQYTPEFAEQAREYEVSAEALVDKLGALQTINFKGVGPGGADIYETKFDNGTAEWRIVLDTDGKIAGVGVRTLP